MSGTPIKKVEVKESEQKPVTITKYEGSMRDIADFFGGQLRVLTKEVSEEKSEDEYRIRKDLKRQPFVGDASVVEAVWKQHTDVAENRDKKTKDESGKIPHFYVQGIIDGKTIGMLILDDPFVANAKTLRSFAYRNDKKQACGFFILHDPSNLGEFIIGNITNAAGAQIDDRQVTMYVSGFNLNVAEPEKAKSSVVDVKSIPLKIPQMGSLDLNLEGLIGPDGRLNSIIAGVLSSNNLRVNQSNEVKDINLQLDRARKLSEKINSSQFSSGEKELLHQVLGVIYFDSRAIDGGRNFDAFIYQLCTAVQGGKFVLAQEQFSFLLQHLQDVQNYIDSFEGGGPHVISSDAWPRLFCLFLEQYEEEGLKELDRLDLEQKISLFDSKNIPGINKTIFLNIFDFVQSSSDKPLGTCSKERLQVLIDNGHALVINAFRNVRLNDETSITNFLSLLNNFIELHHKLPGAAGRTSASDIVTQVFERSGFAPEKIFGTADQILAKIDDLDLTLGLDAWRRVVKVPWLLSPQFIKESENLVAEFDALDVKNTDAQSAFLWKLNVIAMQCKYDLLHNRKLNILILEIVDRIFMYSQLKLEDRIKKAEAIIANYSSTLPHDAMSALVSLAPWVHAQQQKIALEQKEEKASRVMELEEAKQTEKLSENEPPSTAELSGHSSDAIMQSAFAEASVVDERLHRVPLTGVTPPSARSGQSGEQKEQKDKELVEREKITLPRVGIKVGAE